MTRNLLYILFVFLCLSACKTKNAFKYSQDFVTKEKSLLPFIEITENKVAAFIDEEKYDSVTIVAAQMETRIKNLVDSIKAAPAPEAAQGEKFKIDVIKYFEFMQSVYTSYKNYGSAGSNEVRDIEIEKLQQIVAKKESVTTTIQTAQRSFAKSNGFEIEK